MATREGAQIEKITVIFPLYFAEDKIEAMVSALSAQTRSGKSLETREWLEVIFIDNASKDQTVEVLKNQFVKHGNPSHWRLIANPENIGLSRSLNRAFSEVKTPYALTCHSDCVFGSTTYVSDILDLLVQNPNVAALTSLQSVDPARALPIYEKINLTTNLMDLFAPKSAQTLIPVGFVEGRCDGFRMDVLRKIGFYDTNLKLAGEDQILCAQIRALGYEVCLAPHLKFFISVSIQQNSLWKLSQHQRRFGRAHPYILLKNKGTQSGIIGKEAGNNRAFRTILRALQLLSTLTLITGLISLLTGGTVTPFVLILAVIFSAKIFLFWPYILFLRLNFQEVLLLISIQPLYDFMYTLGLCEGLWAITRTQERVEIG